MKLDEAIEIKETELEGSVEHTEEELHKADELSLEALKQIGQLRAYASDLYLPLLPGETEE